VTPQERFWTRVIRTNPNGCWTMPSQDANGYSIFWYGKGLTQRAHRAAYLMFVGPIPDGLDLDHLCRNRACCNPKHVEPVTRSDNLRRGLAGMNVAVRQWSKTHCPRGHVYDAENTMTTKKGHRLCRTCRRDQWTAYRQRRKEKTAA
jgi:hypothetical protein